MPILHWINDDSARRAASEVPFHLLEQKAVYGDHEQAKENLIVHGDNLLALKALLPFYKGKVNCIYIDPPYNTGSAFEHYDDNLEHSQWLSTIMPRLQLLREFLSENGSIWVSADDKEGHYLKILMDEVFGRSSFVVTVCWQKRYSRENREAIGDVHDFIFVYAKNPKLFKNSRNLVPMNEKQAAVYKNPNNDPRGRWRPVPITGQAGHATADQFYPITAPGGKIFTPPPGRCWALAQNTFNKLLSEGRIYFGKNNNSQPNLIRYLSEVPGVIPWSWWPHEESGHNDEAKKEILALFNNELFDTPKPERLIERILTIATNPGDLVLDSFLGSGTTAAVAHKMGRHYIGVEMGNHAMTHCVPRLEKVIAGERGGISESVNWQGGGGFSFYELSAPVFDKYGSINPKVPFKTLAAYLWQSETGTSETFDKKPFLGSKDGVGFYLLYNGVLGDMRPEGGNVLTPKLLQCLLEQYPHDGPKTIYAEAMIGLDPLELRAKQVTFKQIPYDIRS